MSENKTSSGHTPGPWLVSESLGDSNSYKIEGDGLCVKVYGKDKYLPTGEKVRVNRTEANARLIAAAPELLEALHTLIGLWYVDGIDTAAIDDAVGVIAKAKGGAA